jgi:hypothetical protein
MELPKPPPLDQIYDEDILARIDRVTGEASADLSREDPPVDPAGDPPASDTPAGAVVTGNPTPRGPYPVARRFGISGAMLAGAMLGVGEVLEPERARQHIIEFVPDQLDEDEQLVTFHYVPGDPQASRIVIRPWLLERFLARSQ